MGKKQTPRKLSRKLVVAFVAAAFAVLGAAAYLWQQRSTATTEPTFGKSATVNKGPAQPNPQSPGQTSRGWHITTYYTAVEQYHHGPAQSVKGCLDRDCVHGTADLGSYPADFVQKVKNEGAGKITSGASAGRYLNWAYDTGYWLDTIPSDTNGHLLQPFVSAAADTDTLAQNTSFKLADCGSDESAVPKNICDKLQSATWKVVDQFTPGLGGSRHIDLYIGEENQDNFETSDQYVDLSNVSLYL